MWHPAQLTNRQKQVLAFVEDRLRRTGFAPSLQETADHFHFKSANSARQHLRLIEKKGFLHRVPGRSRALVIVRRQGQSDAEFVRVPLLGKIPAGSPMTAFENSDALLTLPSILFRGDQLFALRVHGRSMIGAGILDGDIAILDATRDLENGEIAAVMIEDQATLKRVYRKPAGLLLKPENPEFQDIHVDSHDKPQVKVIGVLVGVVRKV
jgi:repressor LexA